jgi:tetratricopeptide (TPR) repeat protein
MTCSRTWAARMAISRVLMTGLLAIFSVGHAAGQTSQAAYAAFDRGNAELKGGNYEKAETEFRVAIAMAPEFHAARNNLGVALYRQGRFDEALQEFERVAAAVTPHQAGAALNVGATLAGKNDEAAALAKSAEILQANPEYADALYNMGWIHDARGEYAEAEAAYRRAIAARRRVAPTSLYAKAEIGLGIALARLARFDEALSVLAAVLDRASTITEAERTWATENVLAARLEAVLANPFPVNDSVQRAGQRLVLKWGTKLKTRLPPMKVTFAVRIARAVESLDEQNVITSDKPTCRPATTLEQGQGYQWQVTATTEDGRTTSSPVYRFTVAARRP